jgi:hypothetical protein
MLTETGTILLLFSEEKDVVDTTYYCNDESAINNNNFYLEGEEITISNDASSSCIPPPSSSSTTSEIIGQFLVSISTSPHLRCIPLILILLSSTTLIIGIIRTHRQCIKLSQYITNYYYDTIVLPIMKGIFGEELYDEMEVALTTTTTSTTTDGDNSGSNNPSKNQLLQTNVKMKMDNLIIDKHLQKIIQNGMDYICGIGGGIVLYSLPDALFSSCIVNDGKKNTSSSSSSRRSSSSALVRQRVIHAVDPWLERVLFTPGGVWELIPNGLREFIVAGGGSGNRGSNTVAASSVQHGVNIKKLVNDATTCLDTTTQETLVGTEISATVGSIGSTDNETDEDDDDEGESASMMMNNIVPPPLSSVEMRTRRTTTATSSNEPREESVGEALYATICDVVASNLTSAFHVRDVSQQPSSSRNDQEERSGKLGQQSSTKTPSSSSPSTPSSSSSPQQLHIEKVLHHTSIAATTIFLCQFLSSPSTRRSWMSTIKFLTSMGLFSTAVSTGLVSYLLRRPEMARLRSGNSTTTTVVTVLSSKVLDWIVQHVSFSFSSFPLYSTLSSSLPLNNTIMNKIQVVFQRVKEEIKKNKRLQATFALMMLYGIKKQLTLLTGKRRGRTSRR